MVNYRRTHIVLDFILVYKNAHSPKSRSHRCCTIIRFRSLYIINLFNNHNNNLLGEVCNKKIQEKTLMTYTYYSKIFNEQEKKEIEAKLKNQFGVEKIPGVITSKGKEKLFLFQGNLNKEEIKNLCENFPVERIGIYFAKVINDEIRLSIEGTQILKNQITKNIFQLNDEQTEQWMKGHELLASDFTSVQKMAGGWSDSREKIKNHFLIMKYKTDFLGCGKLSESKIGNFIPKSRRLKEKS